MHLQGSPFQPLRAAMRADLQVVVHTERGEPIYVVGDMLGLEYFRLNEQEFFLLESIDGQHSIHEIKQRFDARFEPYQVSHGEIQQYLVDFHHKSLVVAPGSNKGMHQYREARKKMFRRRIAACRNLLAIRFRGINPERLFQALTPWFGWCFSPLMVGLGSVFMLAALGWILAHFDEFCARLPGMQTFFSQGNLWILLAVMFVMKIAHEFGHGILFTKYGGRCHELGVMLLVFVPTLYVNTSDSWRLSSKFQRAAIAAAGVYVELLLAALATFGWWFTTDSIVRNVCMNTMLLGSMSAVLFNGNPLLKFDGYFALTDLIEIPNLQQRSSRLIRNWFLYYGLGIREGDEYLLTWQTRAWLAFYACASFVYRFFVVFCICFLIVGFLTPIGLNGIAKFLGLLLLTSLLASPVIGIVKYLRVPGNRQKIESGRGRITLAIAIVLALCVVVVPLPHRVLCDFTIQPENIQTVYVKHDASLVELHVAPMQWVDEGEPLATLRNLQIELEITELEGELLELETDERLTLMTRYESTLKTGQLARLRTQRQATEARLEKLQEIQTEMTLRAPVSGHVIATWQHSAPKGEDDELEFWDGSTFAEENIRAEFLRGQVFCQIGNLTNPEAHLLIDQTNLKFVRRGQTVELLLDSNASQSYAATIHSISQIDADQIDALTAMQYGGHIETKHSDPLYSDATTGPRHLKPANSVYEALVPLPQLQMQLEAGLRGTAKVRVGERTLAQALVHFMHRTFRIDL